MILRLIQDAPDVSAKRGARPSPVEVAPVTSGAIFDRQTFSGSLQVSADFMVAAKIPGRLREVLINEQGIPQERIVIDRAKVADVGLTVRKVAEALKTAGAGRSAGDYRPADFSYRMLFQLKDVEDLELEEILDQTLTTPSGEVVALRNVITTSPGQGPAVIKRKDQQRTITIDANVSGRDIGSVASEVQQILTEIPT